jgi:hypothetical protein
MNCQEVQTQLSDYLDQSLDTIRLKSIENHLLSCIPCRAEAESLVDCIGQIRDLPMVEPPPGFAQRVMAHARETEIQVPFWQRLFFNVKFTLPVQASAVVLIAVFAVLLYQRETGLQKSDRGVTTAPLPPLPALTQDKTNPVADAAPSNVTKLPSSARANNTRPVNAPAFKNGAQAAPQSVAAAKSEKVVGDAGEAPRRPPIQAQEVATGLEPLRPSAESFGAGGVAGNLEQPLFRAPFAADRALSPFSDPISDVEFVVRRRPPARRDQKASAAGDTFSHRVETETPVSAAPQNGSVVEVRWFNVPADRYEQFRKELMAEATIESEKGLGSAEKEFALKSARDLLIKVMVLSPAER